MEMQFTGLEAPPAPKSLETAGLSLVMMREVLLKTMFRTNREKLTELERLLCFPSRLIQELVDLCRDDGLIETTGTLHAGADTSEMGFRLSERGKSRAQDALSQSEYYGAMPVPLKNFGEQVKRQSIRNIQLTRERLSRAMGHLILPPTLIDQLGPAVGSGRSMLMYGPPGNGKSSISNGIRDAIGDNIYVPHSIEYAGQIISVYDPIVHTPVPEDMGNGDGLRRASKRHDRRYVLCQRPTVITGGELTLEMLDLVYNPVARTYTAPLQLKSAGGVFIVDDLGRQADPPQSLINRWIVPLEESKDILALQSGEKFEVPFDTLVIFSTNFHPNKIFDQAALRRIFYKVKVDGPDQEGFLKIFALVARKKNMPLNQEALIHLLKNKYPSINNTYANYQPVFLIDQMIAICDFEGIPYQMTPELIDRAWSNMFVTDEEIVR